VRVARRRHARVARPENPVKISRSSEYAIRALAYIALAGDRWVLNREIAKELSLPPQFLTKILGVLAREGLLESQRGRTGGFRLARSAKKIRLLEIVDPFDRLSSKEPCVLGQSVCDSSEPCPLHDAWRTIREEFRDLFRRTTLDAIVTTSVAGTFPRPGVNPGRARRRIASKR
jgi:Rrf2 family protein